MNNVNHAIDLLVAAAEEYAPRKVGDGVAHLQDLGLFIEVRELQSMESGVMAVLISEFTASTRERQKGITITCVGRSGDMPSAVGDAVAQWVVGVMPVLVHWRGKHSCLATSRQMETQGGLFDLLAGPVIARGRSEGDSPPATSDASLSESMRSAFRNQRPVQRLHWLELFCCKRADGSVDASCRLDNRNWTAGREVLVNIASAWPNSHEPLQSCRQFAMLLPKDGNTQEITVPTFWSWLFGRA
jgi:hypothetical protein